jgi:hypothetical protein
MSAAENAIWEQLIGREENDIKNGVKMYTGLVWLRTCSRNWLT